MEWRIRECGHGGYVAEYGAEHEGGVRIGFAGSTMPSFIVYHSANFDTVKQAERYINAHPRG